uniref:Uncharacterized protein n=1 Tax=Chelydra serpentina TaxID=8475 RepID=A0A8C3T6E4_CHESE
MVIQSERLFLLNQAPNAISARQESPGPLCSTCAGSFWPVVLCSCKPSPSLFLT